MSSLPFNPGVRVPVQFPNQLARPVPVTSQINQIKGVGANLSTGPGIPKHVTGVSARITRASGGVTSAITVSFQRDPSDKAFAGVAIYARGYQQNNALVQVGGGIDSPVTVILNNTGEAVGLVVQAQGNSGSAPVTTAPSTSLKLPLGSGGGYGTSTITSTTSVGFTPPAAEVGDVLRFNVNGDGLWDATNLLPLHYGIVGGQGGTFTFGLATGSGGVVGGTGGFAVTNPTATNYFAGTWSIGTASTLTCGVAGPENGNNMQLPVLAFYRCTYKVAFALNTNCRYWLGLASWFNGSGVGNNGAQVVGTTAFATDTPNKNVLGFRYSPGTDTHWQAVSIIVGASPTMTLVDTGVAPVSNTVTFFDMATNTASTSVDYYINHVKVATISNPNLPTIGATADSFVGLFAAGDNKNTANLASVTNYWMGMSIK